MSFFTFAERASAREIMDDPECDEKKLIETVKQFGIINLLFSSSRRLIKKHLLPLMNPGRLQPYTLLEIGAGGCDTALWLADYCRKKCIRIKISCLDNDPRIAAYTRAKIAGREDVELVERSVVDLPGLGEFDFVFSNHFLHHFSNDRLVNILNGVAAATRKAFLMNDLRRSRPAYLGYRIFSSLFLHNSFAAADGLLSIRRGFLRDDLKSIVEQTKNPAGFRVGRTIPGRIYLVGRGGGRA